LVGALTLAAPLLLWNVSAAGAEETIGLYENVLSDVEKSVGPAPRFLGALRELAELLHEQKQDDRAEKILLHAIKINKTGGNEEDEGECLTSLADIYHDQKNFEKAKTCSLEALRIANERGDGWFRKFWPVRYASKLQQLGKIETALKEYPSAEAHYTEAITVIEKAYINKFEDLGRAKRHLAWCLREQGKIEQASAAYEDCISTIDKAFREPHYSLADTFLGDYEMMLKLAGKTAKAKKVEERILRRKKRYLDTSRN